MTGEYDSNLENHGYNLLSTHKRDYELSSNTKQQQQDRNYLHIDTLNPKV